MEHTFAYRNHPEVWAQATPFTGEDILKLDAFCRQRHVELVPNQNSLGHTERWLKHERYHHLAECPDGFEPPWGGHSPATTLNPLDPGSIELMASLYDELLPHFTSKLFNVGGDEPWELGKGKSKSEVEARGGRVYLDYITKLHNEVTTRGHKMQFWGDIIVHHPDLVPELPKDVTAMLWGYEGGEKAAAEWERQCTLLEQSGVPFYVSPGTSSWNSIAGRSDNAIDNCRISAISGLNMAQSASSIPIGVITVTGSRFQLVIWVMPMVQEFHGVCKPMTSLICRPCLIFSSSMMLPELWASWPMIWAKSIKSSALNTSMVRYWLTPCRSQQMTSKIE